jgi:hypothetical protein
VAALFSFLDGEMALLAKPLQAITGTHPFTSIVRLDNV